ncbi:hypothetical protein Tco_1485155 [Tanacetum coccineum]
MNRGSILHEDLTYAMLHEMVMKKFNLEAIYPLNLSAKVSSIDDNFDITDDHEVQFFIECACNSEDEVAHLYVSQHKTLYDTTSILENRQENTFYNFFEQTTLENIRPSNNIKNTSFDKNGLDLNFGTNYNEYEDEKKEFDDVVDDNPLTNYQKWQKYMSFKPDIPETPLYKSKPMISKDYKKETEVKVGNIFDNKEALDLAIRLKALDEGYQFLSDRSTLERFTSPPRRSFVGGLVATVDPVELEKFSTIQVKRILTYSLGYDENSATFLYLRKPNCSLDSGLVPLADALQDRNMLLTYAQSHQNRLHVYVSRVEISPLVVADQHKDEGSKKEKHGKPSCSKKLFD